MGRGRQRIDKGAWGECHGVLTLKDAMARHGKPDIFNTDQGSQFTGSAFTGVLATNGLTISMDGKGACGTTCSSSACGAASNTRRRICGPTKAYPMLALRSAATWTFIMGGVHTRVLTAPRPIKPTSPAATPLGSLTPAEAPLIPAWASLQCFYTRRLLRVLSNARGAKVVAV